MLVLDYFGGHAIPSHIEKQYLPPFTKCEGIAIELNFFAIIICKAIIRMLCIAHIKLLSLDYTPIYLKVLHMRSRIWGYSYDYPTNIALFKYNHIKL
jgi:hypothetical protein